MDNQYCITLINQLNVKRALAFVINYDPCCNVTTKEIDKSDHRDLIKDVAGKEYSFRSVVPTSVFYSLVRLTLKFIFIKGSITMEFMTLVPL